MKNNFNKMKMGDHVSGFDVRSIDPLPKLDNVMYRLKHKKTGALLIHLANDDDNNCFSVAFRTTPKDSTGVAHILEHTALCGSKRYSVRDPFFSMIRRSMNTFMNAFTASDWTMYPFSSQNEKDFYNLMDVYLDAAFYPQLTELNFKQEGHRLEFEDSGDASSPLVIKGVVYNEMKGAMSSQSQIMYRKVGEALFPTATYGYNSGGDPEKISALSHQELIDFHKHHYHPSNSLFYTYGDIPLEKHLQFIDDRVLSNFDAITIDTLVKDEVRFVQPRSFQYAYPLNASEDDGKKVQIAINWLTCSIKDPVDVLSLHLINLILLGYAGAPLKKVLMESKLGKSLADTTGYESESKETWFSVGMQGVAEEDVHKVEQLIMDTLQLVVREGVNEQQIELAIHQMELDTREISGGQFPYALNLLFRFFGTWMHGGDPLKAIDFDQSIDLLRKKLKQENYLESQIKKFLLDNPHRVKVVLNPDPDLEQKTEEDLRLQLDKRKKQFNPDEVTKIIEESKILKGYQEQEEDLSILPSLKISDIPREIPYIAPLKDGLKGEKITFFERPTNGILYAFWYFDIDQLNETERTWLPTLSTLLPNVGAAGMNYQELAEKVSRYTGGFHAGPGYHKSLDSSQKQSDYFSFSGKALYRNIDELFGLASDILNSWDFNDLERVMTLITQRSNSLTNSVSQAGHSYAASLAKRKFSRGSQIHEIYSGIHQVQMVRKFAELEKEELSKTLKPLQQLLKKIFNRTNLSMMVVGEKEALETCKPTIQKHIKTLESTRVDINKGREEPLESEHTFEAWLTTTPVSYVARSFKTYEYLDPQSPALLVFSSLLKSCYLHGEIREKGGAYGAMTSYDPDEGIFTLLSYRDPHFARTLKVFEGSLEWLKKTNFSDEQIKEAILQTCARMDTPVSPAGKASAEFSNMRKGRTREMRDLYRKGVLSCTREQIVEVGTTCLEGISSIAAISSEEIVKRDEGHLIHKNLHTFSI